MFTKFSTVFLFFIFLNFNFSTLLSAEEFEVNDENAYGISYEDEYFEDDLDESFQLGPKKYRIERIGCSPKYIMQNYKCEVGLTWQQCAQDLCGIAVPYRYGGPARPR
jgi:hypothetical protein